MPSPRPSKKILGTARFIDGASQVDLELETLPAEMLHDGQWWERKTLLGPDDTPDGRSFALYRPWTPPT
jgi:hypothetical protein